MGDTVKRNTVTFVTAEVSAGTYVAPSAGTQAIQTLEDGTELAMNREFVDRSVSNGTIGRSAGRAGMKSVSGSIPCELKAADVVGTAPETDLLLKSALGDVRNQAELTLSDADGGTHSTTVACLADADANKVKFGDTIVIRRSGATDHIAVVTAVSNDAGDTNVTFAPARSGAVQDGDTIRAFRTYICANSGHPSLSITKEIEGAVLEKGVGCKVTSMSIGNFTTGALPDITFGFEGLTFDRTIAASGQTADYQASTPPLILGAKVFVDGAELAVNEVSISLENTLGFKTSTASLNGRISSRTTDRIVSGSFNPYKADDDIAMYTKFVNNTAFDLFLYAYNPDPADSDQVVEVVGIYLPNCIVKSLGEANQDGLLQETIEFEANRGDDASTDEIFITVI